MKDNLNRYKLARLISGFDAKTAADWTGRSVSFIKRIESGACEPPIAVLRRLAELYWVSTDFLLGLSMVPECNPQMYGANFNEQVIGVAVKNGTIKSNADIPIPTGDNSTNQSLGYLLGLFKAMHPGGVLELEVKDLTDKSKIVEAKVFKSKNIKTPLASTALQNFPDKETITKTATEAMMTALNMYIYKDDEE